MEDLREASLPPKNGFIWEKIQNVGVAMFFVEHLRQIKKFQIYYLVANLVPNLWGGRVDPQV